MHKDIEKILFSREQIDNEVTRIAEEITRDYQGKAPILIGLLKGSYVFLADLARKIELDCSIDFLVASSYGNSTVSSGSVKLGERSYKNFINADVILIEDILDSGRTLSAVRERLLKEGVRSVKICTLLDKPDRRCSKIYADYFGMTIPDLFVVGYGMDYAEKYRTLPYIGVLKPEIYS